VSLREEARAAYLAVARTLVATLVAAGRHGEARRRYRIYGEQMGELGVEAAPFPSTGRSRAFSAP